MSVSFDYVPRQADLEGVKRFLYSLTERLNAAFGSIDTTVNVAVSHAQSGENTSSGGTVQSLKEEYQAVKALILKTADTVNSELERIEKKLSSSLVAKSEFGEYTQTVDADITAQADSITQAIRYYERLNSDSASFSEYVTKTEGYITSGIVDWDGSLPLFGIAIGQNLQKDSVTVDGEEYQQIRKSDFRTVITSTELAFWRDSVKVAYMSSSSDKLFIPNAHITNSLSIGSWVLTPSRGLTLKYL